MTALLIVLALVFAWACIATATAVSWNAQFQATRNRLDAETARVTDLVLQIQSRTAGEYAASKHIAMRPYATEQVDGREFTYDDTGLIRMPAAPLDEDTE